MRRIRGVTTRGSLRGFLAAARRHEPARHRRARQARRARRDEDWTDAPEDQ